MSKQKQQEESISIMEAVDTLSSIAQVDLTEIEADKGETALRELKWLKINDKEGSFNTITRSFQAVHQYLKKVATDDSAQLGRAEVQRGLEAIMILAGEAAEKFDKCASTIFQSTKKESAHLQQEVHSLQEFYHLKIAKRFQQVLQTEEAWMEEFSGHVDIKDVARLGLKDLEMVKRDKQYELLYLKDEDGKPFVNRNLLRHIKLVADFESFIESELPEDPFLQLRVLFDKELHETSKELLERCNKELREFYQIALKLKEHQILSYMNMAMMALMLASKERSLAGVSFVKSSTNYFRDFQYYIREALQRTDYHTYAKVHTKDLERLQRAAVELLQALMRHLFERSGSKGLYTDFFYDLVSREKGKLTASHGWHDVLDFYDVIESYMKRFPSGPLLKTLDVFKERELYTSFDPFVQDNIGSHLYTLRTESLDAQVIRLPSPTHQETIQEAQIIEEFRLYLRQRIQKNPKEKVLIISNHNRTDHMEFARANALEKLSKEGEFVDHIYLLSLPKRTDFYEMKNEYLTLSDATSFKTAIEEQFMSLEACGFLVPKGISKKVLKETVVQITQVLFENFFGKKEHLTRKARLDFIDLLYTTLSLKIIELIAPDVVMYTCKDGVDDSLASAALLFGVVQYLKGEEKWKEEERDLFFYMCIVPPCIVRDRLMDNKIISRMMSSLEHLRESNQKSKAHLQALYSFNPKHLRTTE